MNERPLNNTRVYVQSHLFLHLTKLDIKIIIASVCLSLGTYARQTHSVNTLLVASLEEMQTPLMCMEEQTYHRSHNLEEDIVNNTLVYNI